MTLLLYGLFLILSLYFFFRGIYTFAAILPLLLVLAEFVSGLQERTAGIIKISMVMYLTFMFLFIAIKGLDYKRNSPLLIFTLYVFIAVFFSSDIPTSLELALYTIPGFVMFFISSAVFSRSNEALNFFLTSMPWIIIMFLVSFLLGQLFQVGTSFNYGNSNLYIGGFGLNRMYTISIAVMLAPLWLIRVKSSFLSYIIILLALVSLVITMRRTSFVSIALFYAVFILTYRKTLVIRKSLQYVLSFGIVLALTFPWYSNILIERVEARESTLEMGLEEEGRIIETYSVLNEVFGFKNTMKSLFGQEMFNTSGKYAIEGVVVKRKLHNNFNMYLFCTGIIGFMIFVLHVVYLYFHIGRRLKRINRFYYSLFVAYYIAFLFLNFSGTYGALALNVFQYAVFGAFYAIAKNLEFQAIGIESLSHKKSFLGQKGIIKI